MEQYLKRYGQEGKQRLIQAVQSGYFELTGGYFHMAELLDYRNLSHSLDYASDFIKENGLTPVDVAVSCDVNGFSWGFAGALYEHGIRFLSTNINTHHDGAPFRKPLIPFWWESPKGEKLLVWNGLTYHRANCLGLLPDVAPGGNPGIPGMKWIDEPYVKIENSDFAYSRLREMVQVLKDGGYPYDFVPLMGSGLCTDNSPVGDAHCDLIAEFNEKHSGEIEVQTVTMKEFFQYLTGQGLEFPTYSADWNDWWTDGVLSTPNETRLFRNAQRTEALVCKLDPQMSVVTPAEHEAIQNTLITYAEHTWGHSHSLECPYNLLVTQLDLRKAKLAIDADVMASTALDKVSRALGEGEFATWRPWVYHVINPHPFEKEDVVYLPSDFWEDIHFSRQGFRVVDEAGNVLPSQRTFTMRGSMIACTVRLKPQEKKVLRLVFDPELPEEHPAVNQAVTQPGTFENASYEIQYGPDGITSVRCKATGEELLDPNAPGLGAPVYQIFPGASRWDAAGFGYSKRVKPQMEIHHPELLSFTLVERGPVFTHLKAVYRIQGAVEAATHFYLYEGLPKIQITAEISKELVRDSEGMYICLPFQAEEGTWFLDKAGAFFRPGEQLPLGCCDYYAVNRGLVLAGARTGLAISTLDSPLVTINGLKLWDYTTRADTQGPVYSWLCNNKWETNFRTQCAGYLESRYVIELLPNLSQAKDGLHALESNEHDLLVARS